MSHGLIRFLKRMLSRNDATSQLRPDLLREVRLAFDPAFYAAQVGRSLGRADPLAHFLSTGWRRGFDPSAAFSVSDYLTLNPDVAAEGINPLVHYIEFGKAEGRGTAPSSKSGLIGLVSRGDDAADRDASDIAPAMDLPFYSFTSGLEFDSQHDAALHYLDTGWRTGLDPSPDFSTKAYLQHYPDVAQAGIPPFLHFLRAGKSEGRTGTDQAAAVADILTATPDLKRLEAGWLHGRSTIPPLDAEEAATQIIAALTDGADRLVIGFTHDDFRHSRGGIQLCVGREAAMATRHGADYLALFPVVARPRLAPDPDVEQTLLYAIVGEARIGPVTIDTICLIAEQLKDHRRIDIVVHALLGHAPEQIEQLYDTVQPPKIYAWLHDMTLLCPSYALQRNRVTYCGGPPITSTSCTICLFGEERVSHLSRLKALVGKLPVHAIAPSPSAADMVTQRIDYPFVDLTTLPHATLSEAETEADAPQISGPTTIAFAGIPSRQKGYAEFEWLVRHNFGRTDLRFVYLGSASHRMQGVRTIGVEVTADNPLAMIDALRDAQVDFVLHWANGTETFSFSTMEAILSGADVITHPGTGNVAALVRTTGRGHILADRQALAAFLDPEPLAKATALRRAPRPALVATNSDLTFAVMDAPTKSAPVSAKGAGAAARPSADRSSPPRSRHKAAKQ